MPNNNMQRFTPRARRVLALAQEYAEQLQHTYIGTEHILVGLIREEKGIAGRVLRDLGLQEKRVEEVVEELNHGLTKTSIIITKLAPSSRHLLEKSVDEARRLGHHFIGTEHLLLGLVLLPEAEGIAIDVLKRLGISPEEVRLQTRRVLQESPVQTQSPSSPPTSSESIENSTITLEGGRTLILARKLFEQQDKRHVRVVVGNRETQEELFTLTLSLLEGLEKLDQLLLATVPDNQLKSVAFESDTSPIRIEIHVENEKEKPDD